MEEAVYWFLETPRPKYLTKYADEISLWLRTIVNIVVGLIANIHDSSKNVYNGFQWVLTKKEFDF